MSEMDISEELIDYVCKAHNWKRNYFTEFLVRNRKSSQYLADKLGVSKQNICNWLKKDESEWSDSVRAMVNVLRKTDFKLV